MSLQNVFLLSGSLFCLLASVVLFAFLNRGKLCFLKPAAIISLLVFASCAAYGFSALSPADFITPTSFGKFILPAASAMILAILISFNLPTILKKLIAIILPCAVCFIICDPTEIYPAAISALLWILIYLALPVSNYFAGVSSSQTVCFGCGILILGFIGAVPSAIGCYGICLAAAAAGFLLFNWPPSPLNLSNSDAEVLGFLIGGIAAYASIEGSTASALIFVLFPLCEGGFALLQKITFIQRFSDLTANTAAGKAVASGLDPITLIQHILRINIMMLLFGCMQAYAPDQHSLPLVCAAIIIWQMYRLIHWNSLSSGISETNKNIISEFKKNFAEIKTNVKKASSANTSQKTDHKN